MWELFHNMSSLVKTVGAERWGLVWWAVYQLLLVQWLGHQAPLRHITLQETEKTITVDLQWTENTITGNLQWTENTITGNLQWTGNDLSIGIIFRWHNSIPNLPPPLIPPPPRERERERGREGVGGGGWRRKDRERQTERVRGRGRDREKNKTERDRGRDREKNRDRDRERKGFLKDLRLEMLRAASAVSC